LILRGFISGRGRTLKSILPNAKGGEYTRGGEITEMKVRLVTVNWELSYGTDRSRTATFLKPSPCK